MNGGGLMHPLAAAFEIEPDRDDVVVFLHGWTGSPAQLRPVADRLADAGLSVVAPRHAGHGTHIGEIVTAGWRDWVAGAVAAAESVEASGRRLHLAGLSMGGLLAILLAAVLEPASLTVINAPYRVTRRTLYLAPLMRGSRRVRVEPQRAATEGFDFEHDIGYRDTPVGSGADLLDLMRGARRAMPRVTAPALVVQSRRDETVRSRSGQLVHDRLGSPSKRLVWLEWSGHVATLDVDRDVLAREMIEHIETTARREGGG